MKFNKGQAECCAELGLQPRAHRRIVSNNAKQCRKYLQEFLNDIPARQLFDSSDNISDFQARAKSFVSEYGARLWGQAARSRLEPGAPVYPRDKASIEGTMQAMIANKLEQSAKYEESKLRSEEHVAKLQQGDGRKGHWVDWDPFGPEAVAAGSTEEVQIIGRYVYDDEQEIIVDKVPVTVLQGKTKRVDEQDSAVTATSKPFYKPLQCSAVLLPSFSGRGRLRSHSITSSCESCIGEGISVGLVTRATGGKKRTGTGPPHDSLLAAGASGPASIAGSTDNVEEINGAKAVGPEKVNPVEANDSRLEQSQESEHTNVDPKDNITDISEFELPMSHDTFIVVERSGYRRARTIHLQSCMTPAAFYKSILGTWDLEAREADIDYMVARIQGQQEMIEVKLHNSNDFHFVMITIAGWLDQHQQGRVPAMCNIVIRIQMKGRDNVV